MYCCHCVAAIRPSRCQTNCQYRQARELQAADGSSIATYGKVSLTLHLGLRRTFRWLFIVADINTPILGSDFLREYGPLVDLQRCQLCDATTDLTVTSFTCDDEALQLRVLCNISSSPAASVLHEFSKLIQPTYTRHNYSSHSNHRSSGSCPCSAPCPRSTSNRRTGN